MIYERAVAMLMKPLPFDAATTEAAQCYDTVQQLLWALFKRHWPKCPECLNRPLLGANCPACHGQEKLDIAQLSTAEAQTLLERIVPQRTSGRKNPRRPRHYY